MKGGNERVQEEAKVDLISAISGRHATAGSRHHHWHKICSPHSKDQL